jgi:hypothetical protein
MKEAEKRIEGESWPSYGNLQRGEFGGFHGKAAICADFQEMPEVKNEKKDGHGGIDI